MANEVAGTDTMDIDPKWWMPLVMGIVGVVFGLLLISHPAETGAWVTLLVGIYWMIAGVVHIFGLFIDRTMWAWKLALGIIGLVAGVIVIDAVTTKPLLATIGLASVYVWVLGLEGIVFGILQIVTAFKGAGWGTGILGALSVVLGGLLVTNAVSAGLVLPWVFGIIAIVFGTGAIVMAFRVKKAMGA